MNRRELLKLTCGAFFAPLLKWLPEEEAIIYDNNSLEIHKLLSSIHKDILGAFPRFTTGAYGDWETFKYRTADLSIDVTPLNE